ncbi:MAG: hypothetical protein FJ005_01415 [Chloroflexi bacterium]|nr:hypothetical protein [Chloroflexota bacterium]
MIVDDIDSLEGQDEAAISFFVSDVSKTPSKILFTSRRSLFGYAPNTTQVNGFNREDGIDFIKSRIALFGLRPKDFAEPHFDAIIRVTDGSPLYIEELLRFCCVGVGLKEAMATWEKEGGDLARQFALKREFDMLSPNAKQVLLAFCLNKGPSTLDDAEVITGLSKTAVQGVLGELQRLFLIPRPTIVKGIPRFDININTRSLVLNVMSQTDVFNKIQSNVKRLSGELRISGERRLEVTEYLKQGAILTKLERFADAEGVLQNGLRKYPDDPDILAQLGRTYARWKPIPRIAEAKAHFRRAAELKCSQEDMYYHWWGLECKDSEWSSAALAAESAAKLFPNNWKFKFYAGYACSRLGRQLKLQFASDRARYQLRKADKLLTEALALINLEDLDLSEYHLHGDILRCLVLNCEAQGHVKDMARFLTQWQKEHPDDSDRIQECSRLIRKYPDLDRQLLQ